jgi:hypothetical protein
LGEPVMGSVHGWQMPAEHVPPPHEWPQVPQLFASVCRSKHVVVVPQRLSPDGQLGVQPPEPHVALPPVGTGHAAQLFDWQALALLVTHVPASRHEPPGHTQLPPAQLVPPEQACEHPPQLLSSVCSSTHAPEQVEYPLLHVNPQVLPAHDATECGNVSWQTLVHEPQCWGSVAVSTHELPQSISLPEHAEAHA